VPHHHHHHHHSSSSHHHHHHHHHQPGFKLRQIQGSWKAAWSRQHLYAASSSSSSIAAGSGAGHCVQEAAVDDSQLKAPSSDEATAAAAAAESSSSSFSFSAAAAGLGYDVSALVGSPSSYSQSFMMGSPPGSQPPMQQQPQHQQQQALHNKDSCILKSCTGADSCSRKRPAADGADMAAGSPHATVAGEGAAGGTDADGGDAVAAGRAKQQRTLHSSDVRQQQAAAARAAAAVQDWQQQKVRGTRSCQLLRT
jgi:hypothetical protein